MKLPGEIRHGIAAAAIVTALLITAIASGCARRDHHPHMRGKMTERQINTHIVNAHFDEQARAATLTTRTLYPHHFHSNLPSLNLLGERELNTLLANANGRPVRLGVHRGPADSGLYEARLATISERLAAAGFDEIEFVDELPPGPGMTSDRAIRAIQRQYEPATADRWNGTGRTQRQ